MDGVGGLVVVADEMVVQETLNYWKQLPHVLKYFRETENPTTKLPQNFMQGFLEVTETLFNHRAEQDTFADHRSSGSKLGGWFLTLTPLSISVHDIVHNS